MSLSVQEVAIRSPCPLRPEELPSASGDFHCEVCGLDVTDLSSRTEADVRRFLETRGARACVRYTADAGGRLRTRPDPLVSAQALLRRVTRPLAAAALVAVTAPAAGCGPVVDALPTSVREHIPFAVDSMVRHPITFATCVADPACDPWTPPITSYAGGI